MKTATFVLSAALLASALCFGTAFAADDNAMMAKPMPERSMTDKVMPDKAMMAKPMPDKATGDKAMTGNMMPENAMSDKAMPDKAMTGGVGK